MLADVRVVKGGLNAMCLQHLPRADSGKLQQLWRVDGSCAQQHLASRPNFHGAVGNKAGNASRFAVHGINSGNCGVVQDLQVGSLGGRVQESSGRGASLS